MAGVLTDAGERTLLDLLFNQGGSLSHRYIGLSTTAWTDAGTGGTEPTDSAYTRQIMTDALSNRQDYQCY